MYPEQGNEEALGMDYRANAKQWAAAEKARITGQMLVAGPVKLVQGGEGLIGRVPVYVRGSDYSPGRFWGLVSAVIDVDRYYSDVGLLDNDLPIAVAIRGRDATGADGAIFFGRSELFNPLSVTAKIKIPGGSWLVAAEPKGGWAKRADNALVFRVVGGVLLALLLAIGAGIARLVGVHEEQEIRLRSLFEFSSMGIALNDFESGNFVEINDALIQPSGYSREEFLNLSYWDLTPKEYEPLEKEQLELLRKNGRYGPYEKEYIAKSGERYPVRLNGVLIEDSRKNKFIWSMIEDISSRRQALLELERSRNEMQKYFDLSYNLMAIANGLGYFEKVNHSFVDLLGYTEDDMLKRPFLSLVHNDDLEATVAVFEALKRGETTISFINRYRCKDNTYVWLSWNATPDPETGKYYAIAVDVTPQIEKEKELLRQREILESMSQQGKIGAWELDLTKNELYWSSMIKTILELEPNYEPQLQSALEFYKPGESRMIAETALMLCIEHGKPFEKEVQVITAKGCEMWVSITGKAEFDDKQCTRVFGSFKDIQSRKTSDQQIEQAHRELEQQLRLLKVIADSQSDFIEHADIRTASGYLLQNIIDLTNSEFGLIGEIIYPENGRPFIKTWAMTDISWDIESRKMFRAADGSINFFNKNQFFVDAVASLKPIIVNDSTLLQLDGMPPGHPELKTFLALPICKGDTGLAMVGVANRPEGYDQNIIAWLNPLLNSIAQFVESVHSMRVRQRTEKELLEAKDAAEAAAKAKSEFLAVMSHEIRTPLNGMIGMLNLLKRSKLDEEQQRKLKIAFQSSESLLTIINDILDFSKVDAGKIELEHIEFDLMQQLDEFVVGMAARAQEKRLELVLDTSGVKYPFVKGDPGRLRQVMSNLVSNAIKFTTEGEVVIRCCQKIEHLAWELYVDVLDSGPGIPENKIDDLFNPFTQVDASTTRTFGGTGLGLAICKNLCALMGGGITATSTLGKGSCFSFNMHLEVCDFQKSVIKMDLSGKRLMVIDSNEASRAQLQQLLRSWSAEVVAVENGEQAIFECEHNIPALDAVIVDQYMQKQSGLEWAQLFTRRFEDSPLSAAPLIAMVQVSEADYKPYIDVGYRGHINKPVTNHALIHCLSTIFDGGNTLQMLCDSNKQTTGRKLLRSCYNDANASCPRLLIVEDNAVNQEVVKLMLDDFNLILDIAGNGIEALNALQNNQGADRYSIVLMDCQMPELDGYETTKKIRNGEAGEEYIDVPVIAMTANALKGDSEKCLAAGMSDYIAKPLNPQLLETVLMTWLKKCGFNPELSNVLDTDSLESKEDDRTANFQDIDSLAPQAILDYQALLESMKQKEHRAQMLLNSFSRRMPDVLIDFDSAVNERDLKKIAYIAHSVKGSAGQMRANALYELAGSLEAAARDELAEIAFAQAEAFRELTHKVIDAAKTLLKNEADQ